MHCDISCTLLGLKYFLDSCFRVWRWREKASSAPSVIFAASIFHLLLLDRLFLFFAVTFLLVEKLPCNDDSRLLKLVLAKTMNL